MDGADVDGWLRRVTDELGIGPLSGWRSVRDRPWGTVLRVSAGGATLWFKAAGPGGRHEPTVVGDLGASWPALVPRLLAADPARGWLLMPDHGAPIRQVLDAEAQVAAYQALLPTYAELQAATAPGRAAWTAAGMPDRRVARLPEALDGLLAGVVAADAGPRREIEAARAAFGRVCEELAATPWADALDHGDLHNGNVLAAGSELRLADWGDSCVTHPFSSLFVTLQLGLGALRPSERFPAALRLRDAYLDAWPAGGAAAALREAFRLAVWVGHVTRALDFAHHLPETPPDLRGEWGGHIAALLDRWRVGHAFLARGDQLLMAVVS